MKKEFSEKKRTINKILSIVKMNPHFQPRFRWDAICRDRRTGSKTCLDTNRITRGNVIDIGCVRIAIFSRSVRGRSQYVLAIRSGRFVLYIANRRR